MSTKNTLSAVYFLNFLPIADSGIVRRHLEDLETLVTVSETLVGFHEVKLSNRMELWAFLQQLAEKSSEHNQAHVILHIDAHSNTEGIEVNEEMVSWTDFFEMLRPANLALHGRLSLHLAACKAAWSLGAVDITQSAPFMGCIAPSVELSADDSIKIYRAFYENALGKRNYREAVVAMLQEAKARGIGIHLTTAADMFCDSAISFLKRENTEEAREKRLDAAVSRLTAMGHDGERMREDMRKRIWSDPTDYLKQSWKTFTLLDIYPDLDTEVRAQMPAAIFPLLGEQP